MWGTIRWISSKLFALSILSIFLLIGFIIYLKGQPLPDQDIAYTTKIYSRDHQIIDNLHTEENRVHVPLEDISTHIVQATVAIEDQHFYQHFGVDVKGVLRAIYINFQNQSRSQGGSTITQQLAKNLYLTHEKTWERKFYELILTAQLELHYSKSYILEKYLNQIYYGHGCYGVEAASQRYFGKSASELTLAESTLLAGVPKGPSYYSPFLNYDNAMKRQKLVLHRMVENGYISQQEMDDALTSELVFHKPNVQTASALYFRDYVIAELVKLGYQEDQLRMQGLEITTTLNLGMQQTAAALIDEQLSKFEDLQAALVTVNPENGDILAMVGGRDYKESPYNRVLAKRQAGSTFKPFVYLAALDSGLSPVSKLKSEAARFTYDNGRQSYTPRNFNDFYFNDDITFLKALAVSDNVVAVKTNLMVRPSLVKETAQTLGIQSYLQEEPSLALGAFPVSPMEMTVAYGTIASQGIRIEPRAILEIRDRRGKLLYASETQQQHVHDPETLYILTDMMRSVFEPDGTGFRVKDLLPFDVAGKTGTTDTDAWMIGFTPDNVTSVWVGYDRDRFISRSESYQATPIWANYMAQVSGTTVPVMGHPTSVGESSTVTEPVITKQHYKQFPIPKGVAPLEICLDTGELAPANGSCTRTRTVFFVPGTEPVQ
ncbi:hypothetical protein BHU72_04680 [Desulfuribacillus stibiiarsenatis]|uniref:Uncharacterized protein n=1 Tax=Desulfuribacillus stibiiarsenatis TaxID=1390249 RepID=A0A1E5L5Y3_9FIRM|nr:PBP1A family penicillin-binding protein [Desulfuribacillus stibiiarsenatis]OEH85389.1 hypothetical protein BHU72_04680 [Desulfuribacillus stibiiarsenatis]